VPRLDGRRDLQKVNNCILSGPEDPANQPSPATVATTICRSSERVGDLHIPGTSRPLFWPLARRGTHVAPAPIATRAWTAGYPPGVRIPRHSKRTHF